MRKQWEGRELEFEAPFWREGTRRKCDLCRKEFLKGEKFTITNDGRMAHPACIAKLPE